MIVVYGGRIVALELFDAPETLTGSWTRLIRAATLDTLTRKPDIAIQ